MQAKTAILACYEESCLVLGAMTKLLQLTAGWLQALDSAAETAYSKFSQESSPEDMQHAALGAICERC